MRELSEGAAPRLVEQALDALPQALFVVSSLRPGQANVLVNTAYAALTGYEPAEAVAAGFDALAIFVESEEVAALDPGHGQLSARKQLHVRRSDGTTLPATLELRSVQHGRDRHLVGLLAKVESGVHGTDREAAAPFDTPAGTGGASGKEAFF